MRAQQPTNCGGVRCPNRPAPLPFSSPARLITSSLCLFLLWAAGKEAKFISGPRPPNEPETRLHLENKHHDSCATRPQNSHPKYLTQLPGAFLLSLPQKKRLSPRSLTNFSPFFFFLFSIFQKKIKRSYQPGLSELPLLLLKPHSADKHSLKYKLIKPGTAITFVLTPRLPNSAP